MVFDVGETLVDESRMWTELAQRVGVTPLTLGGVLGALIATGRDHHDLWDVLGALKDEAALADLRVNSLRELAMLLSADCG